MPWVDGLVKERLTEFIGRAFGGEGSLCLACGGGAHSSLLDSLGDLDSRRVKGFVTLSIVFWTDYL